MVDLNQTIAHTYTGGLHKVIVVSLKTTNIQVCQL